MQHRKIHQRTVICAGLVGLAATCAAAPPTVQDPNNRINNPFRTQFTAAWNVTFPDPVKLIDVGPVTDPHRSNLVLLVAGRTAADTQRKLRVTHWNGNNYDLDGELASQSIGIDTLLLGKFHPGTALEPASPPTAAIAGAKPQKRRPTPQNHGMQILTNAGIYSWASKSIQPVFARQLPDVKQSIVLDNRPDMVVVGAGEGASPFEFTVTEMRPAVKEKLQGGGYARFGIGLQSFPGAETVNIAPGIRYAQSMWSGRSRWVIGLVRGRTAGTIDDPTATTGDRLIVYTPRLSSRDKSFWETRMEDLEEAWRSEPLPGRVLDVRVGDPHNDGKIGILVLTAENDDKDRRLIFFAATGNG